MGGSAGSSGRPDRAGEASARAGNRREPLGGPGVLGRQAGMLAGPCRKTPAVRAAAPCPLSFPSSASWLSPSPGRRPGLGTQAAEGEGRGEKAGRRRRCPPPPTKPRGSPSAPGSSTSTSTTKTPPSWPPCPPRKRTATILQLLHQTGLSSGLGSNPVGLDRGLGSDTRLLRLRKVGNKVLFEQLNTAFRADSESPAERRAVAAILRHLGAYGPPKSWPPTATAAS